MLIKNFDALNKTPQRKICLELINAALSSIQPQNIVRKTFSFKEGVLTIQNNIIDLKKFERIFLLGFGKGSAGLSKEIENMLGNLLTKGYIIDLEPESQSPGTKIELATGTHPLPSEENINFTKKTTESLRDLTEKDLVLIVIAGGGSVLFENPYKISLEKLIEVNKSLLSSGATITEMNIVRKHLSFVKGGGLAKLLYPSKIISIIASDVPGNDFSVIASGPTVKDTTTKQEALEILKKYNLTEKLNLSEENFLETPKEDFYFTDRLSVLLLSNKTALLAMKEKANELGFEAQVFSDKLQGEAKTAGKELIRKIASNQILLAGGETTVKVLNKGGKGGRNQDLVLAALPFVNNDITIASFDSDGWDNTEATGAIGDAITVRKAEELSINPNDFLENNDSFSFFEKTGDRIVTGRLPSNVSDLMIVIRE